MDEETRRAVAATTLRGATRTAWAALYGVADADGWVPATTPVVAEALGIEPSRARRLVRQLQREGYLLLGTEDAAVVVTDPTKWSKSTKMVEVDQNGRSRPKQPLAYISQGSLFSPSDRERNATKEEKARQRDSRVRPIIERFDARHRERFGRPYPVVGARDAQAIRRLPEAYDEPLLLDLVDAFWRDPDPFIWQGHGPTIPLFTRRVACYLPGAPSRRRPLPDDFVLTPARRSIATRHGCGNPGLRFAAFVAYHRRELSAFPNWDAAWELDCVNHDRHGCPCQRRPTAADGLRNAEGRARETQAAGRPRPAGDLAPTTLGTVLRGLTKLG